jgi:hypothetical protein
MSESEDQHPVEPDPFEFAATAEFRYGIFLVVLLIGLLVYGATWVPRLFRSAAPAPEAPVARELPHAEVPPPQPGGCSHGAGGCDWAGLRSPPASCHNGVGACDWTGLKSTPHDKVVLQSPSQPTPSQPTSQSAPSQSQPPQLLPSQSPQPQSVQSACHNGVGTCSWGSPKSMPPRCLDGVGACDKVAVQAPPPQTPPPQQAPLQSQPPACHNGVGACGWGALALKSTPPRCRDGAGACVRVAFQSPRPRRHYDGESCDWAARRSY